MKYVFWVIITLSILACNTAPKHAKLEAFWTDFQKTVADNNHAAVADMTIFPLKGTEFVGEDFNENGLNREQFIAQYEQVFDEKIRQAIAANTADKLIKFVSEKAETLERIGVPPNTEIYSFNVSYVSDEGLETQTESSVSFYFLKKNGVFKLAFLLIAG